MHHTIRFEFTAEIGQHAGPASWYFVSLPQEWAKEIRSALQSEEEGWGRLKASAQVGSSTWKTAIWFDTKANTYLLPLKADIRKKEKLETGQTINVIVWI